MILDIIPKYLAENEIDTIIAGFVGRSEPGQLNEVIIVLLSRLGVRAIDVCRLRLRGGIGSC